MEIKNATTVHRIWGSLDDAELIAAFQYHNGAETYCKAAIASENELVTLVIVDHYTGEMTVFRKPAKAEGQS